MKKHVTLDELFAACRKAGLEVRMGGKHWQIYNPATKKVLSVSCTGKPYAAREAWRDMRRYWGLEIEL